MALQVIGVEANTPSQKGHPEERETRAERAQTSITS